MGQRVFASGQKIWIWLGIFWVGLANFDPSCHVYLWAHTRMRVGPTLMARAWL